MPYTSEHKAATRARIVESARKLFNQHGFDAMSIDQIMAGAGLTRGGFYHHFSTKDQLYSEAVAFFAEVNPFRRRVIELEISAPLEVARVLVNLYLGDEVFHDVDMQCPLYALPNDVLRAGTKAQEAYTDLIRRLTQVFLRALEGEEDAEQRAPAIVALCVGGMVLARTSNDAHLRAALRASSRQQALALLESRTSAAVAA
ncbi:MAG: TetR/AcrR family transcriptional regulator [Gammaproteobacteria bacterium]